MIFLSHNYKDKPVVEQFAVELAKAFGRDNIFYDSWSIQPGEGIIDKMNQGLGAADLFLFFVSANSLGSKMVGMEWQNGLMKASQGKMRLVPIKMDAALIPPILMQTVYLDLFNQGLEVTLRQVLDLAKGNDAFTRQFANFSNLQATVETLSASERQVTIEALHFTEPRTRFLFLFDESTSEHDVTVMPTNASIFEQGFTPGIVVGNGARFNGALIGESSSLAPKFPFRVKIDGKNGKHPDLKGVLHQKSEHDWELMPIIGK
ncbi:hypothetical protein ASD52_06700 [Ensifer sp. Root142]|uniref:toll/interleukin-1 receptor domain-containing protein n=1 Tax=Ensifer sp. Root142 TaxID=1736461 RepID=UPI0007096422|nr:toll/interleukin-1 receptor domain-containing protein [Ensifer sp. Root142]KQY71365.1 hypothetical protein ASD52_06700 [Ensifer sp. Root142]